MNIVVCIIVFIVIFIIGIVIGNIVGTLKAKAMTVGRLRIDHSEPDEPAKMFLELKGVTPEMIASNKFVKFEVINESYLSRN